jgi:polysaccharide pyruvyl transferase WcaK-like protein
MKADYIYLRDRGISEAELATIGVQGDHVKSTFDDALFFDSLDEESTKALLSANGIDLNRPYAIINFHYWGQSEETRERSCQRFAELSDYLADQYGLQLLFVPMAPTDEAAEDDVIGRMQNGDKATRLNYHYDYREARAVYQFARMVFTMKHHPIIFAYGEGVPVVSVALDDYYYHKNKGAMDNCGHGRYCLDQSTFYSDQARASLDAFFGEYDSLKNELSLWLSQAREIETEPMERFIQRHGFRTH